MRKNLTLSDANQLPGFVMHENGYSFESPAGRCKIEGAFPMDQVFRSSMFGLLNVSKALAHISTSNIAPQPISIGKSLRKNVSKAEYDHDVVKRMSIERRGEPILLFIGYDGLNVIDGVHRIKRCVRDGVENTLAYILRSETLRYMRVRIFHQSADGSWKQTAGLTDEQVDEQINLAKPYDEFLSRKRAKT